MAGKYTAETQPYTKKAPHPMPSGSKASYTPNSPLGGGNVTNNYGKDGGKANAQSGSIPSVEANGSVVGALPAIPAVLKIGEDKNVSTPVSGG